MLLVRQFSSALLVALMAAAVSAQETDRIVDPREFGLDLPPGVVSPGEKQAVTTADEEGQPVVGRMHVRVGNAAVVLLPDGELVGRREGKFAPTDRKFEPLDKDKLTTRVAAEFPGFKTKSSTHYIYVYDSSEEFQFGTARILETMLPGVKGWIDGCKINTHNPAMPLVVVMFRTEDEFRRYRRMPPGVVAYYDPLTNRVFIYEQSRLLQVRPDLALGQAISTIAHEGVHQILHNIGVQQRLSVWPMWLSEGLAEFFAPTSIDAKLRWKGPGQVNDLRMFELEQYVRGNAAKEPTGELVEHTVLAGRLTSTGYASAWSLVHYLAKAKRSELMALIREASRIGPLEGATDISSLGIVRANRESFVNKCGDNFKELETRLVAHLKKQPYTDPFLNAEHFVATFVSTAGRRPQKSANSFHSIPVANKWLSDLREKLPDDDRATAQATIRRFPNRVQAETYMRQWLAQ
jgi:Protein of unknown function (DUF1570)